MHTSAIGLWLSCGCAAGRLSHRHVAKQSTQYTRLCVHHRCISFKDSACRCFGYAVSKKRFVYTIDDDCFVAKDPTGEQVNALAQHIKNLTSPSTPFFFNTLYDPYAEVSAGICMALPKQVGCRQCSKLLAWQKRRCFEQLAPD